MRRFACFSAAGLVLAGVLLAGCGAPSSHNQASASPSARSPISDWPLQKLAEAHAHYGAGVVHDVNDEPEAALHEYYLAALDDPENESLVLDVSRRFLQTKQPEKALGILSRAAERPSASGAILAQLGLVYSQLGKNEQAAATGRLAIKKAPGSLVGYQNLFVHYLQTKQPAEALKVLDEAARHPKPSLEFLIGLGELYANFALRSPAQRQTANAKARAVFERAEKLNPPPPLRSKLADDFALAGDNAKAAQLYADLLKTLPEGSTARTRIHAKLAEMYVREGDHQKASEQLQAILKDDPANSQACYSLGRLAVEEASSPEAKKDPDLAHKKLAEAIEDFQKTVLLSPDYEQAYYDLAYAQISLNKGGEALTTLEKARHRFSQNFLMELLSAMAFGRQKAYAQAIQHYTAAEVIAQATDPSRLDAGFYFELGAAYERNGDLAEAEKYFQKCLRMTPGFAEAMNYLGYMWAEHGQHLDQARDLIEKAVKAEPKNAAYLDSLGWVLFKLNQPKQALDYILKAVELSEEPDATVYDHLGDIYAALNEAAKAREAWTKSLSLEASDDVKKKLEAGKDK